MHDHLSKAYELLGVKPGVSNRDLKAAHRDLAKVWHPDRFLHDPRLQDKAQEKLKEINEAYELLSSGRMPRAAPPRPAYTQPQHPAARRSKSGGQWIGVSVLLFVAVFALTITYLLQRRTQPLPDHSVAIEQPETVDQQSASKPDANLRSETTRKPNREELSAPEADVPATEAPGSVPSAAVETVTIAIDPESGKLAKADCPVRSRMTYPRGSEPSGYCNINHAPPPKDSKIKSIAKSVGRALD